MSLNNFIAPVEFFTAFTSECENQKTELAARWNNAPLYTKFVREVLFQDVAKVLRVEYYGGDFTTLDGIMFCSKDLDNFASHMTYPHSICVALEQENVAARSMEEINKLQHVNASLKVLVTYPGGNGAAESLLERYATAIHKADVFQDFSSLRRQLVIFGSKPSTYPVWTGHVYGNDGFSAITV